MPDALLIRVTFPRAAYSGGELGTPEELPSPARVHAAFTSAAAGGPWARVDGQVLVAHASHEQALHWLEEHEPLGVVAPLARLTEYRARRHRLRAARDPYKRETDFEPFSALDGPIVYVWPVPGSAVFEALRNLAPEITHVGTADSIAIVDVVLGELDVDAPGFLAIVSGRGPGRGLRVPAAGRFAALVAAHRDVMRPGSHTAGSSGRQAADMPVEGIGERATRLARFAPPRRDAPWPFSEVWRVPIAGALPRWVWRTDGRVGAAVAVHRAIVAAVGSDVPAFVTGRDGDRPLLGAGHLAIHFMQIGPRAIPALVFALPTGVPEADRSALLDVLARRPTVRIGGRTLRLGTPELGLALPFWSTPSDVMTTEVPMVLDAPGTPRRGRWTLDDAVLCSVGYALRGVLEAGGMVWGAGWDFRQALVAVLQERGVQARARRVNGSASRFSHRAREGDLLVAVHATVALGELAGGGGGLLALGRARHLGGGLLRPVTEVHA